MKNNKLIRTTMKKAILLFSILLLVTSCYQSKKWVYQKNDYNYNKNDLENHKLKDKIIAVLPFKDKRSNKNINSYSSYLIPFVPFGYQELSSPETVDSHLNSGLWVNFNPKEDFAKALVEDLNSSNLFVYDAFFSHSSRYSNYRIEGEILSTDYKGKKISYGLSAYAYVLWYVGFPATHISNDLEIRLKLVNSKTKKSVFKKTYKADHYKKLGWVYNLPNDFYYPEMLKGLYKEFLDDVVKN